MLKVDRLAVPGLPPLSFEVAAGECVAIEGPSGSGKTRILRAVADLDAAGGYVFLDGAERGEMSGPAWRRQVRFVSAEPAWWADTVPQHVRTTAQLQKLERYAKSLGLERETLARPLSQLSTGERLRLGLARALADDPAVVLLDEPTAALDPTATALTEELIRFLLLQRRSIVLVSHDENQIARLAHKRLLLAASRRPERQMPPDQRRSAPDDRIGTLAERWGGEP